MAIPSFFRQNKPRGFNYVPRYYDAEKEERDARRQAMGLEELHKQEKTAGEGYRSSIRRGSMREYFKYHKQEKTEKHTLVRLIVIVLVLVLITYLYLRF